jgi:hypothetical protein
VIRFACTCGTELHLPLVLAGESGRCPSCRRTLKAPIPPGHVPWHEVQRGEDAAEGVRIVEVARDPMANRTRALLAFPCPACAEPLRIKVSYAGKPGKCGHCAATFKIPERPAPEPLRPRQGGWGAKARAQPAQPPAADPSPPPQPAAPARAPAPRPTQPPRREPPPTRSLPPRRTAKRPPPPPVGREAFRVVSVACVCGRKVKAPLVRVRAGEARCPSCDEVLAE